MGIIGLAYYQSTMQLADDTDSSIINKLLAIFEQEFKKHPKDFREVLINNDTVSFKAEKYDWFRLWRHTLYPVSRGSFTIKKKKQKILIISEFVFTRMIIMNTIMWGGISSFVYLLNPYPFILFCLLIIMPCIWFFFLTLSRLSVDLWVQSFLKRSVKRAGGIIQKQKVEEYI